MQKLNRRQFLSTAGATAALCTGCGLAGHDQSQHLMERITAEMRAGRHTGKSKVALVACKSYEEDLYALMSRWIDDLKLPSLIGKTVIVKPNMIEYRKSNVVTTNAAMVKAVVRLADRLGAKEVIVAEGPGHFRDTEYLLKATGIGQACKQLGVRFVDLNLDELVMVPNPAGLCHTDHFFLPRTVVNSGTLISVPKLKTHHWVGVTCSMKNIFGVVPGRKYGWPKNFLHWQGIPASILDLVRIVKPVFAVVDAVTAMQGDGPINGTPCESGFIAMGTDLAAVDATCATVMGVDPSSITYLKVAEEIVGNTNPQNIEVLGASVQSLSKNFQMPESFLHLDKYMRQTMDLSSGS